MDQLRWGIIGCGDVTEVKSGPAFNKVPNSSLKAVMRRDAAKAEDYARRHGVPKWYAEASQLIHDDSVDAIYIATPPSSHEQYAIEALRAGKPVYLEKPMSTSVASCERIAEAARESGSKLTIAHYRRYLPLYLKVKELLPEIGDVRFVNINTWQTAKPVEGNWRLDPAVSGGGIFHDLAPHQLDIMQVLFGEAKQISGAASRQSASASADDLVFGNIHYGENILVNGLWCFNVASASVRDTCEIVGSDGYMRFPFFGAGELTISRGGREQFITLDYPEHVQQPMIAEVVKYFLGQRDNPCSAEEGIAVAKVMEKIV